MKKRLLKYGNSISIVLSLLFIFVFIFLIIALNLAHPDINNIDVDLNFNEDNAYSYVDDQLNINSTYFRIPGTKGREDCADYFISKFQAIDPSFNYTLHNFTVQSIECQNVLFKLNENKTDIVILGAHYDSRAKATKDPSATDRNKPVPGANDGASGCAVLIELANVLYQQRNKLNCQIWFIFFDAEDQGVDSGGYGIDGWGWCEGSNKFVEDIDSFYNSSTERINCMLLLDMVGGINLQFIAEQYSTSSLMDELFEVGRQLGYIAEFPAIRITKSIIDDHYPFVMNGIPSADLIINFWFNPSWPYHHTIRDDITSISRHSLKVTGKTVEQFIYNNYLNITSNNYQGYYPWNFDMNALDSEYVIVISIFTLFIAAIAIISYLHHHRKLRNKPPNKV